MTVKFNYVIAIANISIEFNPLFIEGLDINPFVCYTVYITRKAVIYMNSLNKDLVNGQKVILDKKYWKGNEKERTVIVGGGFGMKKDTSGSALFVKFPDGEETRANGSHIEKLA